MLDILMLSIFRQSELYLSRYLKQVEDVFDNEEGKYGVVWLEGDSTDNTYQMLLSAKGDFEKKGHYVNLIKYDCKGPYWQSRANKDRWLQLSTCWNKCLEGLVPSRYTICVESDIRYDASVVPKLMAKIDEEHHVIYPMLMADRSLEIFPNEIFYDIWGFSRGGKKFSNFPPYFQKNVPNLREEVDLLQLDTGGGMIVSTYEYQKEGRFGSTDCIMHYPATTKLYMHKFLKIYHPAPPEWDLK